MAIEDATIYWIECDLCGETYGHPDEPLMDGWYEDERNLQDDFERDGGRKVNNKFVCSDCLPEHRIATADMTGIQQAALMHGKAIEFPKHEMRVPRKGYE